MTTVSVVTGAAGDMGVACARMLAADVDVLLLTDIDQHRLDAVAQQSMTKIDAIAGDIADQAFVSALVARAKSLGTLRALVHTAGLSPTMADAREIVRVDLAAVPQLLDAFLPSVAPGSVAVCIASIAGHIGAFDPAEDSICDEGSFRAVAGDSLDSGSAYRLAKHAVIRHCERAAVVWGQRGGRVVSVSPGLIDTAMGRLELEHNEIKAQMAAMTPVGGDRTGPETVLPGKTSDIANAVAFLCSERAAFISGCDIRVDGGLVAAMNHRVEAK